MCVVAFPKPHFLSSVFCYCFLLTNVVVFLGAVDKFRKFSQFLFLKENCVLQKLIVSQKGKEKNARPNVVENRIRNGFMLFCVCLHCLAVQEIGELLHNLHNV